MNKLKLAPLFVVCVRYNILLMSGTVALIGILSLTICFVIWSIRITRQESKKNMLVGSAGLYFIIYGESLVYLNIMNYLYFSRGSLQSPHSPSSSRCWLLFIDRNMQCSFYCCKSVVNTLKRNPYCI